MKMNTLRKQLSIATCILFATFMVCAGTQPKFTIVPITPTTVLMHAYSYATVQYRVTNQTKITRTLTTVAIPGISINTAMGNCPNPFILSPQASCLLTLELDGNQLPPHVFGGPEVCKTNSSRDNTPSPFLCSKPSAADSLNITTSEAVIMSIAVTPVNPIITSTATQQFTAMATYSDGFTKNLTTQVSWASSNMAVATISNDTSSQGLATAVTPGSTSITATLGAISSDSTLTVQQGFAYVTNFTSNSISLCPINANNTFGACVSSGSSGIAFSGPRGIVFNSAATIAYVCNRTNSTVSVCPINTNGTVGVCTASGNSGVAFNAPGGIALNSTGTLAYVSNVANNTVSICPIMANGLFGACALSGNSGTAFSAPAGIALNSDGTFAYVTNSSNNTVLLCPINPNGSFGGCTSSGNSGVAFSTPTGITLNKSGTLAYVANFGNSSIAVCPINANGTFGACAFVGNSGVLFSSPIGIVLNSAETFAYVANSFSNLVSLCPINTNGIFGACTYSGNSGVAFSTPVYLALH